MSSDAIECDVLVIGAGVVGLAIAAKISESRSVAVIESYPKFGQETSSRNSEVIHSGIYYPPSSNKTNWCVRGRELLYDFCRRRGVPFANTGKFVVSTVPSDEAYIEKLFQHCRTLDVPVEKKSQSEIQGEEPLIKVLGGVFLPRTGVVDSHVLMQVFENDILERGSFIAYRNRFLNAVACDGWRSEIEGPDGNFTIRSEYLINCAGLGAAEISNRVLGSTRYEHRYCRGRYFSLSAKYQNRFKRLIYPVPPKDGLGVHITVDLVGQARLGPDVDWCQDSSYLNVNSHYDCNWDELRPSFVAASTRYCPSVRAEDLSPGLIGIRPKLFIDAKASPDFLIENHRGFIHCLGIESPGLTSSLAISEQVSHLIA